MFHVLEHLPDPRMGLNYARKLLKPSGVLLIQVPNVSSIQARLFGSLWFGLDVPRHVINYTPEALSFLLKETGFEPRQVRRFSFRDNPASIASSAFPRLDPIHRRGRKPTPSFLSLRLWDSAYFGALLLSMPFAIVENMFGRGGTIWIFARKKELESV
jgi:hypothetical protein